MLNSLVCSGAHANGVMALTLPKQLRYNDLRLSVGISSKGKERLINSWETQKTCVMAATEFLSNFLANISWEFCRHVGS